ncbi:hypothetical protein Plim_3661 [Planctopirus limnophila DSM 3776]|uniref:Uncharacterized protein n=1 Tax=Planctopirus limnophila (strain ATCC 43296 / DSM 3776 / IFAM 1008 / Mu 290) TaxID=521674 RepID=D5SVW3_PLAL2|nr:hypothetical protein Plim_3661 [Planctopirus limnophila DSM 3776]
MGKIFRRKRQQPARSQIVKMDNCDRYMDPGFWLIQGVLRHPCAFKESRLLMTVRSSPGRL